MPPRGEMFDQLPGRSLLVVLMHRHRAHTQAERIEQPLGVARVLGRDHIHRTEHGERPQADVMKIPERRRHHIQ